MSTVSTQQAQMANNVKALIEQPYGEPVSIQTPTGICNIYNTHLVSSKLIGVIGAILNLEFWGEEAPYAGPHVMSIVLRADNQPAKIDLTRIWAIAHGDTQSIAVGLKKHFEEALESCIELEPTCSIRIALWHEILTSIAHEIHHVATIRATAEDTRLSWTEEDTKAEEAAAKEWAKEAILELATSDLDIEPPSLEEEPLFQMLFMAANLERLANKNLPKKTVAAWDNQLKMLSNSWAWHHPESGTTCKTFIDWIATEEAGEEESLVDKNLVQIVAKETEEVSDPMVADAFSIIPVNAAIVQKETTGVISKEKAEEAPIVQIALDILDKVAAKAKKAVETEEEVTVETLMVKPQNAAPNMFGFTAVPNAMDIAEAMDIEEFGEDEGVEGIWEDNTENLLRNPEPTTASPEIVEPSIASETVPEPSPEAEPESKQAFDPNTVTTTIHAVYLRCLNHIFTKCVPANGIFQNPTAVYEPINISDIPGHEIFCGCDTIVANGQFQKKANRPGWVKGTIFNTSKLPAYHLYLNIGGVIMERRLVPQNANKTSKPAAEARAGNNIAWIIDAAPEGKFQMKYVNGQLNACS